MTQLKDPQIVTHDAVPTAVLRAQVTIADLPAFYDRAYTAVLEELGRQEAHPAGAAFGYYLRTPTEIFDLEAGFPVAAPITSAGEVLAGELPAGQVARATHVGGYDTLGDSWAALTAWVSEQGRTAGSRMWEVYVTEPSPEMDPATLRTDLFLVLAD